MAPTPLNHRGTKCAREKGHAAAATTPDRELLEVPTESSIARQLLVALSGPQAPQHKANDAAQAAAAEDLARPPIAVQSRSALLGRLNDFLPQLQQANALLATQPASMARGDNFLERCTVEEESSSSTGDSDYGGSIDESRARQPHVVMDLACGVLELQDEAAVAAAIREAETGGARPPRPHGHPTGAKTSDTDSSSSSDSDGDATSDGSDRLAGDDVGSNGAGIRRSSGGSRELRVDTGSSKGSVEMLGLHSRSTVRGSESHGMPRGHTGSNGLGFSSGSNSRDDALRRSTKRSALGRRQSDKSDKSDRSLKLKVSGSHYKPHKRHAGITELP